MLHEGAPEERGLHGTPRRAPASHASILRFRCSSCRGTLFPATLVVPLDGRGIGFPGDTPSSNRTRHTPSSPRCQTEPKRPMRLSRSWDPRITPAQGTCRAAVASQGHHGGVPAELQRRTLDQGIHLG